MNIPTVSFEHIFRLSDDGGLHEHAELTVPRMQHGYCVDDVARGLLVAVREPHSPQALSRLASAYLDFVIEAQTPEGSFHNRRGPGLQWQDEACLEDCWGRALWGLGTAVARAPELASRALAAFEVSAPRRSPWTRAMAFAALGAAEILQVQPRHTAARALLLDAATLIGSPSADTSWRWPESRLRYANAALPETLLAAGSLLGESRAQADGLSMLSWLLDIETTDGHLSVTPVRGWAAGEPRPAFDQQPVEVAALTDACARAFDITGDPYWRDAVLRAAAWFLGDNDARIAMHDPVSGGGYDGLESNGRNENQGAESTLALLSTFQQAHRLRTP